MMFTHIFLMNTGANSSLNSSAGVGFRKTPVRRPKSTPVQVITDSRIDRLGFTHKSISMPQISINDIELALA